MLDFFFYGTLLDADVRTAVVGRALPEAGEAVLEGHARVAVRGATYPAIRRDHRGAAPGAVFRGVGPREAARLSHFEGDGYEARRLPVALADGAQEQVWVFVPRPAMPLLPQPWEFESWARRHRRRYLAGVRGYVRGVDPGELDALERDWRRMVVAAGGEISSRWRS